MVLSLTTEADGNEPQYAELVADELGVPPLDVKVVPADTDRFGVGHGFNTAPSPGRRRRSAPPRERIRAKAQWLAGMHARGGAGLAHLDRTGRGSSGAGADPAKRATIADLALYAHGTGELPPGVEGGLDAQAVYSGLTSGV